MSRSKTPKLKKAQQEIVLTATNNANKRARDVFLSNPQLAQKLVSLTAKSLNTLRRSWAPFQPNFDVPSGFGMSLRVQDQLVRELLKDEGLYDIAEEIAAQCIKDSIRVHERTFITTMLEDLIMRPAAESFYDQYIERPRTQ